MRRGHPSHRNASLYCKLREPARPVAPLAGTDPAERPCGDPEPDRFGCEKQALVEASRPRVPQSLGAEEQERQKRQHRDGQPRAPGLNA